MVIAPDGSLLGITPEILSGSPFNTFFIPGLILMIVLGFAPVFILSGLIRKKDHRWAEKLNLYPEKHWSWTFTLYL